MKFDDFIKKFTNVGIDWDGKYGAQCVDLYRLYAHEVWGIYQTPPIVGAKEIWEALDDRFTKTPNTPEGIPQKGDVVIWDGRMGGGYGHVGIFVEGDVKSFKSFDQNWPTGNPSNVMEHKNYYAVKGWFRPKGSIMEEDKKMDNLRQEIIDEYLAIRPMKFNEQGEWVTGEPSEDEIKAKLGEKKNRVERMRDLLTGDGSVKKYWKEKWGVKETSGDVGLQTTIDTYDGTFLALKDALRKEGVLPGDSNEKVVGAIGGLVKEVEDLRKKKTPKTIYKLEGKDYQSIKIIWNLYILNEITKK